MKLLKAEPIISDLALRAGGPKDQVFTVRIKKTFMLGKVANHAVFGNISSVGQIYLPGNIVRHDDTGFKLRVVNKRSAVYPNLHAADRMLQRDNRVDIPVTIFYFGKAQFGGLLGDTDLMVIVRILLNIFLIRFAYLD